MLCCDWRPIRYGYTQNGQQRYRCKICGKTFIDYYDRPLDAMRIPLYVGLMALHLLVEGNTIRGTSRITGLEGHTVLKLLLQAGYKSECLLNTLIRNVKAKYIQVDEMWTFVHTKKERVKPTDPEEYGDQYLWIAMEADTKLVLSYVVGKREQPMAQELMQDLQSRLAGRVQLTTDGLSMYPPAIQEAFGLDIDYAMTKKREPAFRHTGLDPRTVTGMPKPWRITNTYIERLNLTLRMSLKRLGRSVNAFSRTLKHLQAAVSLFFAYYNFCRVHGTLRVTPAMEAGLTDHIWSIEEIMRFVP